MGRFGVIARRSKKPDEITSKDLTTIDINKVSFTLFRGVIHDTEYLFLYSFQLERWYCLDYEPFKIAGVGNES